MKTQPRTIPECDKLLTVTHNRYLAAELWIQLHELLDVRIALPLPRTPVE